MDTSYILYILYYNSNTKVYYFTDYIDTSIDHMDDKQDGNMNVLQHVFTRVPVGM